MYTQHATADVTLGPNKWEWVGVHTTRNSRRYTWSQQMGVGRCTHNTQQQMLHLVPTNGSGSVYTQHATADVKLGPNKWEWVNVHNTQQQMLHLVPTNGSGSVYTQHATADVTLGPNKWELVGVHTTRNSRCYTWSQQMGVGRCTHNTQQQMLHLVPTNGSRSVYTQHATADVTLGPNKWEWVGVHTTRNSRCYTWSQQMGVGRCTHNTQQQMLNLVPTNGSGSMYTTRNSRCYTWSQQMGVGRCTHNTQQQMLHLVPTNGSWSVYTQHATADVTLGPNKWEWVGVHTTHNSRCYTWSQQMGVGRCTHNTQQQMLHLVPTNGSGSVYTQHATADVTLGPNKWEWVGVHTTRNSRCYTWSQQMGVGRCTHNTQQQMLHLVPKN